jgi:AsmA protein
VRLNGTFAELKYSVDYGAIVADIAKQKIDAKKDELKEKLQEQLKGGLKNLFK